MGKKSIKEVCNIIWGIEDEYDLFNKKINDVFFWKITRYHTFNLIANELSLFNKKNETKKEKITYKIFYLFKKIKNYYLHGAIRRNNNKEILLFESPRKKKIDGEYIDIYTHQFTNKFKGSNYELIEEDYHKKHYNEPSNLRSYNDYFSLRNFLKYKLFSINFNNEEKEFLKKIKEEIEQTFDIKLKKYNNSVKKIIGNFLYKYKYYDKLLKKRKPNKVYLVCSYGSEALIKACKDNGIRSIEIQHGTISQYHLGYSFPNNQEIPYFPEQINMFGKYWYESTPIPLEKENIKFIGYPFMEDRINKFCNSINKNNQVLFISQPTITVRLAKIAYEFALNNQNYNVIYKLHPAEYKSWEDIYPWLSKGKTLNNFSVVDSDEKDLYELFSESEYLVGVYSTAVYEGLVLNCKTVLIDLPGIDYMEYLIENEFVKLASNSVELSNKINEGNFTSIKKDYFFKNITSKGLV